MRSKKRIKTLSKEFFMIYKEYKIRLHALLKSIADIQNDTDRRREKQAALKSSQVSWEDIDKDYNNQKKVETLIAQLHETAKIYYCPN